MAIVPTTGERKYAIKALIKFSHVRSTGSGAGVGAGFGRGRGRPPPRLLKLLLMQDTAHFIQYRPESEWAGREFLVTVVPRDREWFGAQVPAMKGFWDEWKAWAGREDRREKLVKRKAVTVPVEAEVAMKALAVRPCRIVIEVSESGVGHGEVHEGAELEAAQKGVPLGLAVLHDGAV